MILSPPPDLVVPSIEAQATYTTGNVMTISYTVRNLGPGEPFERFWQDVVVSGLMHAIVYFKSNSLSFNKEPQYNSIILL